MNEAITATKIKVKSIFIDQAEGVIGSMIQRTVRTFADADHALNSIANTRANWNDGEPLGYMKTDFKIEWEDGETYEGRYDVHYAEGCSLAHQVRHFLTWTGGGAEDYQLAEHNMTRERYRHLLQHTYRLDEAAQRARIEFLNTHALE